MLPSTPLSGDSPDVSNYAGRYASLTGSPEAEAASQLKIGMVWCGARMSRRMACDFMSSVIIPGHLIASQRSCLTSNTLQCILVSMKGHCWWLKRGSAMSGMFVVVQALGSNGCKTCLSMPP